MLLLTISGSPLTEMIRAFYGKIIAFMNGLKNAYQRKDANYYFWRTYDQQVIDLIEENTGSISASDMKWGQAKNESRRISQKNYPSAEFLIINKENYLEWIL